jgi:hypothetical protein
VASGGGRRNLYHPVAMFKRIAWATVSISIMKARINLEEERHEEILNKRNMKSTKKAISKSGEINGGLVAKMKKRQ